MCQINGSVFELSSTIVTVVQPAQAIVGRHPSRGYAAGSRAPIPFAQSKMRPVLVIVEDISESRRFRCRSSKALGAWSSGSRQQLPAPALGNAVLPDF